MQIVPLILVLLMIFAFLIFILRKIMTQNITLATKHLEELNQDYLKKEEEVNKRLAEAKKKSEEMFKRAEQEVEKLKEEIIKKAESERDRLITQARTQSQEIIQQADRSRELLLAEINGRITKEAIHQACVLIQDTLPEQFKQDVHQHWIEELIKGGFVNLERLHIPADVQEISIVSAFSLTEDQRKILLKKLQDVLGRQIKIKEEINPKIVVGLIINIGSLVLDGSLKNKIEERSRSAQRASQE